MGKLFLASVAALAVSFGGLLVGTAAPAMAASCGSGGTTWSGTHLGFFGDGSGGQQSVTTANNWGGDNVCLYVPGTTRDYAGSFAVENTPSTPYDGKVLAYPDTNIGCQGGYCTSGSGLPEAVSANPDPTIFWGYDTTDTPPDSMYDVLIDNEFSAACSGSNPATNANIAIYLDAVPSYTKLGLADSNPVLIDGQLWYTLHVRDSVPSGYAYKTEFAAVTPMPYGISGLDLGAFYSYVENNDASWDYGSNYLPSSDCLQDIGAGFELWQDGYNLSSNGTWISGLNAATSSPSPSPSPSVTATSTPTPAPSPSDSSTSNPTPAPTPSDTSTDTSSPSPSASPTSS
jgi:hypothetical protein